MTLASHLAGLLLLLLLVGAPLPLGAYLAMLGEARAACSRSTQAWLVLLTSWCAVHVAIGLLLGILHRFALGPLVLAESAVALGGAALLQTARRRVPGPPGAAAAGPDRAPHWPERAVLAVLVATGSVLFLGLATQPITEYDSLAYHLPVMAKWYQTGSLTIRAGTRTTGRCCRPSSSCRSRTTSWWPFPSSSPGPSSASRSTA